MTRRAFLVFATLILLGGAFLRLAELHRYPPGLHYDEAADMLLSRDIAWYGFRPFPVVAAYSGREALFYYVAAPLVRLLSAEPHAPTVFATRLTSAFLGLLTIAATMALGRAMFRKHPRAAWIALLAGAWLAVNGPQVWLTRQGFRTSPQPLLEALALWLLFVALHRARRWLFPAVLGGVCAGLTLYVYMAARVFPVWVAFVLILYLVVKRAEFVSRLRRVGAFLLAMAVTALPIGVYYVQHPDVLFDRLAQVGPSGGTLTLAQSVQAHLEMFFLKGDPLLRYNLYPGRPWFDPVSGALMLLGLLVALVLFVRRGDGGLRLAGASVLFAPLLIAPSVIAVGGLPPSHMRSVAMAPMIFFAPALGAVWLADGVSRKMQPSPPAPLPLAGEGRSPAHRRTASPLHLGEGPGVRSTRAIPPLQRTGVPSGVVRCRGGQGVRAILLSFFFLLGLNTWADYRAWAARADLFYDSDGDMQAAAQWLEDNAALDDLIYVYSRYYEHPTVLAYDVDHGQVRWVMQDQSFLPPPGRRAITIYPQSLIDDDTRAMLEAQPDTIDGPPAPDGRPAFVAQVRADVPRAECNPGPSLGGILQPCFAVGLTPGGPPQIGGFLAWDVLRTPERSDLTPVIRIVDAWGEEVTARLYPYFDQSNRWLPGERIALTFSTPVDPANPPGDYYAEVSWFSRSDPAFFLSRLAGDGTFAGVWQREHVSILLPSDLPQAPRQHVADLEPILPGLYVTEVSGLPERAEQGERLRFSVRWYADQPPGDVSPLSLTAVPAEGGEPVRLWQGDPAHDTFPMREWVQFQALIDRYDVSIPPDIEPGRYMLRLDVPGGTRPALSREIEIVAVERSFDAPPGLQTTDYRLGPDAAMVQLAGYAAALDGATLSVRLAWRALAAPDRDYTLFFHVLNPDGSIFSQVDRQPTPATSRWIAGQVVSETVALSVPDEPYRLEIGLYVQENGQRLAVSDETGASLGDAILLDGPTRTAPDARP